MSRLSKRKREAARRSAQRAPSPMRGLIRAANDDQLAGAVIAAVVAGVRRNDDLAALATDLACKAAAGDALAALGVEVVDAIAITRAAGRDRCFVDHATAVRLLNAAGYGARAVASGQPKRLKRARPTS